MTTVSAPTNIAVIKYWGKQNLSLNTPLNDSVSVTLHQDDLRAVTTVAVSLSFSDHRLWLNGVEITGQLSNRVMACICGVQELARDGAKGFSKQEWKSMQFHISSYNTFPTAAGLASSAAGYAALVFGLAQLMEAQEEFEGQLSCIARQGSGSACRSMYGGFVAWRKGETSSKSVETDTSAVVDTLLHNSSKADQIADESHWPEMRALLLVVSDVQKTTSSTSGMTTSVNTSDLLMHRASTVVPKRMSQITQAWLAKDFTTFAELTMRDSNQFHAICLDTYPPICYMNDTSRNIVRVITAYNDYYSTSGGLRAAYTFDAGPNAVLYCLEEYTAEIKALMQHYFVADTGGEQCPTVTLSPELLKVCDTAVYGKSLLKHAIGTVQTIYETRPGPGPRVVADVCNLDPVTGLNTYQPVSSSSAAAAL
jgi:diphosphomevalonate decarboxylase